MRKKAIQKKKGKYIEKMTSCIWAAALLSPVILIAYQTANSRLTFHTILFICGWFSWSFTEYFFHRFVMHEGDQKKGIGKILNHSHHHTDPEDIRVKTGHRSLMIAACIFSFIAAIWANNYFTLVSGYIAGFTAYSLVHVILHQQWSAKLFPGLHKFHIHHHCKHPDKCFGVITTWWDYLFNTIPVTETEITDRIKQFYYKKATKVRQ